MSTGGDQSPDHRDPDDLQKAYDESDGNIKKAAERFDVTYRTVYKWMVEEGIHTSISYSAHPDDPFPNGDPPDDFDGGVDGDDESPPEQSVRSGDGGRGPMTVDHSGATVDCGRCGVTFDPGRETPRSGMDSERCPSCGQKHDVRGTPAESEATAGAAAVTDGGVPDVVNGVVEAMETADGDVHLHIHYHGE